MSSMNIIDCPVKPDAVLKRIAKKFKFKLGIPQHDFSDSEQRTKAKMNFGNLEFDVEANLERGEYKEKECYVISYHGVVLNKKGEIDSVNYQASIINGLLSGCFSCGGTRMRSQTIQDENTPDWFPF